MFIRILFVILLCGSAVRAADNSPSEASIKKLLDVMQVHKSLDAIAGQLDMIMKNAMQQVTQGQPVPAEAQKSFDNCRAEIVTVLKEQFTWDKMEPMYVRIYQKSFTQDEVSGMTAFYLTPAGRSVVTKMPLVMQNSMNETMKMMGPMMQRIQQMQQEVVAEMQASKEKKNG